MNHNKVTELAKLTIPVIERGQEHLGKMNDAILNRMV